MSTHEKLRVLDQRQGYDSAGRVETITTGTIPIYVRQLHEVVLDGDADHYAATDKNAVAYFHLHPSDFSYPPSLEAVDQITLVYRRRS